ncbi:MAG: Panacea domain-containing protein [Bacteroidota bacterium]|jgi:uncharacterized phage-associated protein
MDKFRKRLLEALIFFAREVKSPTKMMLFKLLAELDFRHFKEKGYPVTNLEYEAWPMGPVPREFNREISTEKDLVIPNDFADALVCERFEFEKSDGSLGFGFKFYAKRKPDLSVFSPRQQRILKEVSEIYKNASATEASKASHEPGQPWTQTSPGEIIDLVRSIKLKKPLTDEEAREMMEEIAAFHKTYHS